MLDLLFVLGVVFVAGLFIVGVEVFLEKTGMSGGFGSGDTGEV